MTQYLYLILGLIFLIPTIVVAIWRSDLRRGVITIALLGAVWGPLSEFWFFRDYWHPGSVMGSPFLEDVIYGAGISATASWIYKVVTRRTDLTPASPQKQYRDTCVIVTLYIAAMIVLEMIIGINSIVVAIGVYVAAAVYIVTRRRDLWVASVCSAAMMGIIALSGYAVGMNFLVPEPSTLAHLWLLYKKQLGITILGYVPLSEVVWYTAWGSLLGVFYEFTTGKRLVPMGSLRGRGTERSRAASDDGFATTGDSPHATGLPGSPKARRTSARPAAIRPGSTPQT
jgi:hypothetical protein